MTQSPNMFAMQAVQGDLDQLIDGWVFPAKISANQATPLVPGQAVKIENTAGGVPRLLACADTDEADGFLIRTIKDQTFVTGALCTFAAFGAVMQMTANGAIARNAPVEAVNASQKVTAGLGVNPTLGLAFDQASADGDLIRVLILTGGRKSATSGLKQLIVSASLTEVNAGKVLIPAVAGKKITVTDLTARVVGAFTTTTSVDVQSTNVTPVKVSVMAVAGLTNGAVLKPGDANATRAAGYAAPLGTGDGLAVANVGTAAAGGTSITYTITYSQV